MTRNVSDADILWQPTREQMDNSRMAGFISFLEDRGYGPFADYHALHRWSVQDLESFWAEVQSQSSSGLNQREIS